MPLTSPYLFLEFAVLAYIIGFGWEVLELQHLLSRRFLSAAMGLSVLWFGLDQIALGLDLWTFPNGGTLPFRLFSLPIEEYVLFFLHTLLCALLVRRFSPPV
jgi:lycopene cyclase domain-containing protein